MDPEPGGGVVDRASCYRALIVDAGQRRIGRLKQRDRFTGQSRRSARAERKMVSPSGTREPLPYCIFVIPPSPDSILDGGRTEGKPRRKLSPVGAT